MSNIEKDPKNIGLGLLQFPSLQQLFFISSNKKSWYARINLMTTPTRQRYQQIRRLTT